MQDIIKQVKKIELSTKNLVDGLMAGSYHSIFKGQGIEFSEIREYFSGDDIRTIDWNVTARFNHPYVKEFIEERDLMVYFAFDVSGSGSFGNTMSKKRKAVYLIASLMFSALQNNDNIGLALFTDKVEKFIPARKGKKHALKMLSQMLSYEPSSLNTNIKDSLIYLSKVIKKRSIFFIISDFVSPDFFEPLKILRNKHDIIAVNIFDEREVVIPDVGFIELEDEETGEQLLLDTSDAVFQQKYSEVVKQQRCSIEQMFRKMKIDMISIKTDEPYEIPLKKFFKLRKHKVR